MATGFISILFSSSSFFASSFRFFSANRSSSIFLALGSPPDLTCFSTWAMNFWFFEPFLFFRPKVLSYKIKNSWNVTLKSEALTYLYHFFLLFLFGLFWRLIRRFFRRHFVSKFRKYLKKGQIKCLLKDLLDLTWPFGESGGKTWVLAIYFWNNVTKNVKKRHKTRLLKVKMPKNNSVLWK